jgi:hypothetical protein
MRPEYLLPFDDSQNSASVDKKYSDKSCSENEDTRFCPILLGGGGTAPFKR